MEHIQNIIDIINHVWPSGPDPVQKVRDCPAPLYKLTCPPNEEGRSVVIYTNINGMKLLNQSKIKVKWENKKKVYISQP